ncbi:lactate utilization protein [Clostridium beijerinckii]|uniref:LUD domain-containing protein n=1 Tax=Clostridium beijerinckii TaxID=1520 RepID=A0AAX0B132_CLOBE|nr:lactate utilization protein [Clostridium beijerinckii]NRT88458.1 hypothetical protein [Clostridium beijerinckii]NYC73913.1 hypothetical protein [Clostridium beijerinckii]
MDGKSVMKWHKDINGKRVVDALIKNDFDAIYLESKYEVIEFIMKYVKAGTKVGFGGSITIADMKIQDKVRAAGGIVFDHGEASSVEEVMSIAREEIFSDLYLCSSNAITLDGTLINVDGMGNRISAMTFGPRKVIIVASVDKICRDEAAAFERLENIASPMNNKRLEKPNPCSKTGICMNCKSQTRICRVYSIMRRKPMTTDITVIIMGESGGF